MTNNRVVCHLQLMGKNHLLSQTLRPLPRQASAQVSKAPAESAAVASKSKAITTAEDPTPTEDPRKGSPVFKLGSATIEILNYDES